MWSLAFRGSLEPAPVKSHVISEIDTCVGRAIHTRCGSAGSAPKTHEATAPCATWLDGLPLPGQDKQTVFIHKTERTTIGYYLTVMPCHSPPARMCRVVLYKPS